MAAPWDGRLSTYLGSGVFASRPTTPNIATGMLAVWYSTDTSELSLWDGSWNTFSGGGGGGSNERAHVVPLVADFTVLNSSTDVLTDSTYCLFMDNNSGGGQIRFIKSNTAPPATPYSVILRADPVAGVSFTGYAPALIARNSSSGKIVIAGAYNNGQELIQTWSSYSSFNSNIAAPFNILEKWFRWRKMTNDGTNLVFYCSMDGTAWFQYATTPLATYMSSIDQVGFGVFSSGTETGVAFQSFEVV